MIPSRYSSTKSFPVVSSRWTRGTRTVGSSARAARMRTVASASRAKSSSRPTNSAISSMMLRRSKLRDRRPAMRATRRRQARSTRASPATSAYCTFTATSVPSRSVALCTCASDAAASGVSSTCANTSPSGRPSSRSIWARISPNERGGRASWKRPRRRMKGSGKLSARAPTTWQSFTKSPARWMPRSCSPRATRSCTRSQVSGGAGRPSRSRRSSQRYIRIAGTATPAMRSTR